MTYILPHTNVGWAHAKELLGGVARPLRYRLDLRANINHNISTKGWYNMKRTMCDKCAGILVFLKNERKIIIIPVTHPSLLR